jgi:hypothetical protein
MPNSPGSTRRDLLRALTSVSVLGLRSGNAARAKSSLVYWGTYTEGGGQFGNGESQGIYVSGMAAGRLTEPMLAAEAANPSWLTLHPNGRHLYAVNERMAADGKALPGEVSAFSIDRRTGRLTAIIAGDLLQPLTNRPAMQGLERQQFQKQHIQSCLGRGQKVCSCTTLGYRA